MREGIFEQLFAIAEIAKFSPQEAEEYEDSLKVYRDLNNSINTAKEEILSKVVKNSLNEGIDIESISKITGLSINEIERIKNEG